LKEEGSGYLEDLQKTTKLHYEVYKDKYSWTFRIQDTPFNVRLQFHV
jgi:hypothetical protein